MHFRKSVTDCKLSLHNPNSPTVLWSVKPNAGMTQDEQRRTQKRLSLRHEIHPIKMLYFFFCILYCSSARAIEARNARNFLLQDSSIQRGRGT